MRVTTGIRCGELRQRLEKLYSVEQLRRKAPQIPGAVKRDGRHWRFYDRKGELSAWIEATKSQRRAQQKRIQRRKRRSSFGNVIQHLSAAQNASIFPANGRGMSWKTEFVQVDAPVDDDLLKVQHGGGDEVPTVPTWRNICLGPSAFVKIYRATNQRNWSVDVVKIGEAIVAADLNGHQIFSRNTKRLHSVKTPSHSKV